MKFNRMIFMNDEAECAWLRETHLKHVDPMPAFTSFVLHGQEAHPVQLDLYSQNDPFYNVAALVSYALDTGGTMVADRVLLATNSGVVPRKGKKS